jgi:hypothetical protein
MMMHEHGIGKISARIYTIAAVNELSLLVIFIKFERFSIQQPSDGKVL